MIRQFRLLLLGMIVTWTAMGCGGESGPKLVTVEGKITIDGEPLEKGSIRFAPSGGNSSTTGTTVAAGAYTAQVPIGKMRVEIQGTKVVGQRKAYKTDDSPMIPIEKDMVPARYNSKSDLTFEVTDGSNHKDFELKSK